MRFSVASLIMAFATTTTASAAVRDMKMDTPITTDSKAGRELLSQARRVEDNNNVYDWISGYSLKFQGCHHVQQWNAEADGENEPKIQTRRLVRFRMCPADTCSYENASGCKGGYGDYIIDLDLYLQAYWQNKVEMQEWNCEYTRINECGCDADGKDDNFSEESCEYACFMDRGMDYCWEGGDPDKDDDGNNGDDYFEAEEYLECREINFGNNNRGLEEEQVQYYLGPYCSEEGDAVLMGVFTDEFCTNFVDNDDAGMATYYLMTGKTLPYSQESMVTLGCISCKEPGDADMQNNVDDYFDEDEIVEMCEELYAEAGKCETNLGNQYPNENACNYIEGIKIVRQDGQVIRKAMVNSTVNKVIGGIAVSLLLLGAYVSHLKGRLDRAKVNINDEITY